MLSFVCPTQHIIMLDEVSKHMLKYLYLEYPISGLVLEAAFNTMEDEAHYLGGTIIAWLNLVKICTLY